MSTDKTPSVANFDDTEIVSAARQLLDQMSPSAASAITKAGYEREFHRLVAKVQTRSPEALLTAMRDTQSKRTYYRRVAAAKHVLRGAIETALEQKRLRALEVALEMFKKLDECNGACPITDPKPRHSKRQDLRGLPIDWREALFGVLQKRDSRFQDAFLVAAISGCRPAELKHGATVSVSDETLRIRLVGAKVKDGQGQPWREIVYRLDSDAHPLVQALQERVIGIEAMGQSTCRQLEVKIPTTSAFTSAIRRAGRLLWPRRRAEITPYCLRHAAASDWKAGLAAEEVSQALGHLAPDTKRLYGQYQMSRGGGLQPATVTAGRPLRGSPKCRRGTGVSIR